MSLERWRSLIEPVLSESATPVPWETFCRHDLRLYEGKASVLCICDGEVMGRKTWLVWVAAGDMDEVKALAREAESDAREAGVFAMSYLGRRGWLRAEGYREVAVIGLKEL